ncbi:RWP-RK domain-containing protein [Rhynchospora pubera]|uniref:RWP-RK domain-containing protein n=1 Tax=Rhynchospora pubera TaxID=906938 RepID=A0AAV8EQ35_9POAL|nr:RWP-RK domain-containing protein [Rhynchospora pubera]
MVSASNHIRRTYAVRDTNIVPNTNDAILFLVQPIHQFQGAQPLHINGAGVVQHASVSANGRDVSQPLQSNRDGMAQHAPRRERGKRFQLTFDIVAQKFNIPIAKAAKEFGMSKGTLQLRCRELGFEKWPFPKLKCLTNLSKSVMRARFPGFQTVLEEIKDEIESITQNPSLDIKDETNVLRQQMYDMKKKNRRKIDARAS